MALDLKLPGCNSGRDPQGFPHANLRMRTYLHVFQIGIQNALVYRMNFFIRSAFGLVPLLGTLYLWKAVYASKGGDAEVAGYALSTMISYYLIVTLVDTMTAVAEDDWQIAADIRDGRISQFLMKPIDYLRYRLCLFWAGRLVYVLSASVPIGTFLVLHYQDWDASTDPGTWLCFGFSILMTGLLQFFISYTMALLAFWVLEVSTFIFILYAFEYIAGGFMFPLDILPGWLHQAMMWTPFPYQMFFPVSVLLEQVQGEALVSGLAIQGTWVLLAYLLARRVWNAGIRHYSAVGG